MFSSKIVIFYLIVFNILVSIKCLVEWPAVEEDAGIAVTESIIRSTVNQLFSTLKLNMKHRSRLKQFSTIHNFFASITLRVHDNLKEISRLAKAERNINNSSQVAIEIFNELLNEDHKSAEVVEDENVAQHIETFLQKLRFLKETFDDFANFEHAPINEQILDILEKNHDNLTEQSNSETSEGAQDASVLDDLEFWQPSGRRIYRGHRTKAKYFPFMASIQFFNKFQCAGSIIKSDLIITAASCLQLAYNNRLFRENPSFLSVRIGSNYYEYGGENIPVLEAYFHPGYDPKTLKNNLCLMRLRRRIKFSRRAKRVKKIDFDRNAWPLPANTDGVTVVGWGAKGTSNKLVNPYSNQMAFDVLDFYPLSDCRELYSREYVTQKNFCAGFFSKGSGACNRDVGGPGIANGLLTGVVSFGAPACGAPAAPTVFTKLGYYSHWIEDIMDQDVPHANVRTTLKPERLPPTLALHYTTEATTFIIEPLGFKKTTTTRADSDALRHVENELFNEFLKTMFGSDEVQDYVEKKDSMKKKTVGLKFHEDVDHKATRPIRVKKTTTKLKFDDSEQAVTEDTEKWVDDEPDTDETEKLVDEETDTDETEEMVDEAALTEETEKFVDEVTDAEETEKLVDLLAVTESEKLVDQGTVTEETEKLFDEVAVTEEAEKLFDEETVTDETAKLVDEVVETEMEKDLIELIKNIDITNLQKDAENAREAAYSHTTEKLDKLKNDDDILTLLYLSDNEEDKGAAPLKKFKDLTYRNKNANNVRVLEKGNLMNIISDAINSEMNKNKN